jgi:hypothetical protein
MSNWIELNLPFDNILTTRKQDPCFTNMNLDKAGTLIEVELKKEDGNIEIVQYLIGHINENCGVCDDCVAFERNTIVKRYKIVWSPEENRNSD